MSSYSKCHRFNSAADGGSEVAGTVLYLVHICNANYAVLYLKLCLEARVTDLYYIEP